MNDIITLLLVAGIMLLFFGILGGIGELILGDGDDDAFGPKLTIPYYPSDEDDGGHYECITRPEKIVSDYSGLNFYQVSDLSYDDYLLFLRDAVIFNCSRTEAGTKYLDDCWRFQQTKPDRARLRQQYGREE